MLRSFSVLTRAASDNFVKLQAKFSNTDKNDVSAALSSEQAQKTSEQRPLDSSYLQWNEKLPPFEEGRDRLPSLLTRHNSKASLSSTISSCSTLLSDSSSISSSSTVYSEANASISSSGAATVHVTVGSHIEHLGYEDEIRPIKDTLEDAIETCNNDIESCKAQLEFNNGILSADLKEKSEKFEEVKNKKNDLKEKSEKFDKEVDGIVKDITEEDSVLKKRLNYYETNHSLKITGLMAEIERLKESKIYKILNIFNFFGIFNSSKTIRKINSFEEKIEVAKVIHGKVILDFPDVEKIKLKSFREKLAGKLFAFIGSNFEKIEPSLKKENSVDEFIKKIREIKNSDFEKKLLPITEELVKAEKLFQESKNKKENVMNRLGQNLSTLREKLSGLKKELSELEKEDPSAAALTLRSLR